MVFSILHILLAAFGLGLLIFIHEFGHYWMARRSGMTVEVFSIGFGKPIYTWQHKGVKWQFCWLPFGGYVRIAGMEKKGSLEPYEIPDGFYGKSPWARIKVAAIGPIVNLTFAFFVFCLLWISGGREKPFAEYTRLIGWVDPCSDLQTAGLRPGDEVLQLNDKPFHSFQDVLYASMLDPMNPVLSGIKIDYFTGEKSPFIYTFAMQAELKGVDRARTVMETFAPAGYLFYTGEDAMVSGPMQNSGIRYADRVIWADGKIIFSKNELIATINESKALLTVQRGASTFITRAPRIRISDLRLSALQKSEIEDWQHDRSIKGKLQDLYYIPYVLNPKGVVEGSLYFLNAELREESPCERERSEGEIPLQPSDQIIAIDGMAVHSSIEILQHLQTRHIQMIVQNEGVIRPISWKQADKSFTCDVDWAQLRTMVCSVGTDHPIAEMGKLRLLTPVEPKLLNELPLPEAMRTRMTSSLNAQKKEIEKIDNPQERADALRQLEESQRKLVLGITLQDRPVHYNPSPFTLFFNVFRDTWRTLISVVTGTLSPKWLAGPVGMVQVMQQKWGDGIKEALYWLAVISMNLGILNLLPVPVLDGGHICFSLWETVTKKRIKAKTMERLVIPFILLLVALFIYLTYHDIVRLIGRIF